jgi:hypothetical protein
MHTLEKEGFLFLKIGKKKNQIVTFVDLTNQS